MPISSCVICPIFSLSVIWPSSFSTAAAVARAGGPAGVKFRRKNVWLSTSLEAASSAPDGTAATVQTASTITICQSFPCGVDTCISLPSILPPDAGYLQISRFLNFRMWTPENWHFAKCVPTDICKWELRVLLREAIADNAREHERYRCFGTECAASVRRRILVAQARRHALRTRPRVVLQLVA